MESAVGNTDAAASDHVAKRLSRNRLRHRRTRTFE
jgi:hypothetical protein